MRLPRLSTALIAAGIIGVAGLDIGSAAPVAQTLNVGNVVAAATVEPPIDVEVELSLDLFPLPPSCRASISWGPSPTTGVTAYEVRRLDGSGNEIAGPFEVSGLSYVDTPLALTLTGGGLQWEVRAILDGWPSDWSLAASGFLDLCLL